MLANENRDDELKETVTFKKSIIMWEENVENWKRYFFLKKVKFHRDIRLI